MERYLRISAGKHGEKRMSLNKLREKKLAQIGRKWIIEGNLIKRSLLNMYPDFNSKPINPEEGD